MKLSRRSFLYTPAMFIAGCTAASNPRNRTSARPKRKSRPHSSIPQKPEQQSQRTPSLESFQDISDFVEHHRSLQSLPGVAVATMSQGQVQAAGIAGVRKLGTSSKVEWGDRWHLGSCTKSMTATMIARLVEQGKLRWEITLPEAFPDLRDQILPAYQNVTLEMLLAHRGGINHEQDIPGLWSVLWARKDSPVKERRKLTQAMLQYPPKVQPGQYFYSNSGVSIAGHIAETLMGQPWEKLMEKQIYQPLDMQSAGFGVPWDSPAITDPWPHRQDETVVTPGRMADNPPGIYPGGAVHTSIFDWAKYIIEHLRGARGQDGTLLASSTYARLHRGIKITGKRSYALGWAVLQRPWAKGSSNHQGRCLHHAGSNNSWYALAWIAPEIDFAAICTTNIGGREIFPRIDAVIWAVTQQQLKLGS